MLTLMPCPIYVQEHSKWGTLDASRCSSIIWSSNAIMAAKQNCSRLPSYNAGLSIESYAEIWVMA